MEHVFMQEEEQANQKFNSLAASDMEVERSFPSGSSDDCPICWICLDSSGELIFPCKCPRSAHTKCLARWQLQSAGTRKERHCEFCDSELPDWKQALTPKCGASAPAVMNVNFEGRTYSFEVKPGPDGYKIFTEAIRRAFNLPEDSELNITFTCDEPTVPDAGSLLTLQGPGAYDAAVHCASVSAARRMTNSPSFASTSTYMDHQSSSSSLAGAAAPSTPQSPLGLHRVPSFQTPPGSNDGGLQTSGSGVSMDDVSMMTTSSSGASLSRRDSIRSPMKRQLSGIGRRVRSLLDLFNKE